LSCCVLFCFAYSYCGIGLQKFLRRPYRCCVCVKQLVVQGVFSSATILVSIPRITMVPFDDRWYHQMRNVERKACGLSAFSCNTVQVWQTSDWQVLVRPFVRSSFVSRDLQSLGKVGAYHRNVVREARNCLEEPIEECVSMCRTVQSIDAGLHALSKQDEDAIAFDQEPNQRPS